MSAPPDPIPNSEVKSRKAHDSRIYPAKVGSRQTIVFNLKSFDLTSLLIRFRLSELVKEGPNMVFLDVLFKPHTSHEWASARMTAIGLAESHECLKSNSQFMLVANLVGFNAVVQVSDEDELKYSRAISLIPRVTLVKKLPVGPVG